MTFLHLRKHPQILKMLSFVIILTLVLNTCVSELDTWHPSKPCTEEKNQSVHETFRNHHLRKDAPKDEKGNWQKFINKIKTWNRTIQSFFDFREESRVLAVCSSGGKTYEGNLCISKERFKFFTVEINNKKQVKKVKVQKQHVILGCDKIQNQCLPTHFEENKHDAVPDNNKPDCNKAMANSSFIPFEELFHA